MNAALQRPRGRLARRVPRPLSADEAEAARASAGRGAFYALAAIALLLVVVGVNWSGIVTFVRDAIRQGAKDAYEEQIRERREEEMKRKLLEGTGR